MPGLSGRAFSISKPVQNDEVLSALLARCALGDKHAFNTLYRSTSAKLFALALRILRRQDWAEDVLQDAYINIWQHAADFARDKAAPMTWITHIVRNRALDYLRRPQREEFADEDTQENWRDDSVDLLQRLSASREAKVLTDCFARLEAKQRQTIALAFWQGLAHSELAQHLQQPIGTIKTWVRRGLASLRKCLDSGNEI